ncbi:MAG: metal-dependent hydrolase, partial [Pseudomonadota bacterium]
DLAAALARGWCDGDAFKTAWNNARARTLPLGERFFLVSVRAFAAQVTDPKLKQEVRGFCGQEGFHSREHDEYNRTLCEARGYDLTYLEGRLKRGIAFVNKHMTAMERLAITVCSEHITAILAEAALSGDNPELENSLPVMQEFYRWHSAEEMEHKAVAFDVYRAAGGSEKLRIKTMNRSTFFMMWDFLVGTLHMLRRDGQLWRWSTWASGAKYLFGKGGFIRRVWPSYRDWFREDFHPWDRDTKALLAQWHMQEAAA